MDADAGHRHRSPVWTSQNTRAGFGPFKKIKRLRGLRQPQYRQRVGDIRVFYDATETEVQVLAIVTKAESHFETCGELAQGCR